MISFFKNTDGQIYAHKEFYVDEATGETKTRNKSDEEIMNILRRESVLLKKYMMRTYNIVLEIDPVDQYIKQFPFGKRWLRGEEYGFLCRHYYAYSHLTNQFQIVEGNHPEEIYHEPVCKYSFHFS